jgi:hypothetical protein
MRSDYEQSGGNREVHQRYEWILEPNAAEIEIGGLDHELAHFSI